MQKNDATFLIKTFNSDKPAQKILDILTYICLGIGTWYTHTMGKCVIGIAIIDSTYHLQYAPIVHPARPGPLMSEYHNPGTLPFGPPYAV